MTWNEPQRRPAALPTDPWPKIVFFFVKKLAWQKYVPKGPQKDHFRMPKNVNKHMKKPFGNLYRENVKFDATSVPN